MEAGITLNVLAYLIYIGCTIFITIAVGRSLHATGKVFLKNLFEEEVEIMLTINNVLLIGYYLLNIGFSLYTLNSWSPILNFGDLIFQVGSHLSIILIVLAVIHYMNISALLITARLRNKFLN